MNSFIELTRDKPDLHVFPTLFPQQSSFIYTLSLSLSLFTPSFFVYFLVLFICLSHRFFKLEPLRF